ncbi:hypothetical protein APA93_25060 [Pseudomonas aeruginosa]|nr:hypothetical protein APA93_25060 [Pseudomonas aeruginosa]MBI8786355.1 hypothetical protein [Pseudomonas aeruginosa]HBO3527472.1 hypothetical protein [Pseudomonas aeruginosa]
MTDRLPCRACGHLILPTTAARNDGLCMPCKGGYRQNIEDGKRFHTERRRYLASPQALFLVDHGAMTPDCFEPLAPSLEAWLEAGPCLPE